MAGPISPAWLFQQLSYQGIDFGKFFFEDPADSKSMHVCLSFLPRLEYAQHCMPQQITWLHLSDLHFRANDTEGRDRVLKALLDDLEKLISDRALKFDLLFVTGDVAYSGRKKEYENAQRFLQKVWKITHLGPDTTFVVPGNHDVYRPTAETTVRGFREVLNDESKVENCLTKPVDRKNALSRQLAFRTFLKAACNHKLNQFGCFRGANMRLRGARLSIIGLNSAWLSIDEQDDRKLLIGEWQVREVMRAAENRDLAFVLVHHPLDWLKPFDTPHVKRALMGASRILLRGHLHEPELEESVTPDGKVLHIAAGASFETRTSRNAYNFATWKVRTGKLRIYLRAYSDRGYFGADTQTYRIAKEKGELDWRLPPIRRLARPRKAAATAHPVGRMPATVSLPGPRVVVLYATQDAGVLQGTLLRLLKAAARDEGVGFWYDQQLSDARWSREVKRRLEEAEIVICLVSKAFLNTELARQVEAKLLGKGYSKKPLVTIALMVSAVPSWGSRPWHRKCDRLPADGGYLS